MSYSLKIAVSGAHSTGKSSFLRAVRQRLDIRNIPYAMVSDMATRCPFPILRQQTVESSLWMVATSIAEEIAALHKASVVLIDRPVIDTWAYLMAVTTGETIRSAGALYTTYESILKSWVPTYGMIYRTRIDEGIPVEDNKGRDLDPSYRSRIGQLMDSAYGKFLASPRVLDRQNAAQEVEWLVAYISTSLENRETI